jgi:hypothetical protein
MLDVPDVADYGCATYYGKLIGSTKIVVTIAISRKRLRAGTSGSCARR